MIHRVTAINSKNEILEMNLTDPWTSGINVKNVTGISPVGAEIYSTPFGVIDGGVFSGARIPSREIVLTLGMMFVPQIEDSRMILYNFFRIKEPIILLFLTDSRYLQIDGYVKDNDVDIFSKDETATVTVECVDPWFYSPIYKGDDYHGIQQYFEFPFSNESLSDKLIEFGEITIDTKFGIDYDGDVSVGFKINIHFRSGSFHNIYLYNIETRERMNIYTDQIEALTGLPIGANDELVINTKSNNRGCYLIRDGIARNALSAVGKNANWFKLTKGKNVFAFSSDYGVSNIDLNISYQNAYYGV